MFNHSYLLYLIIFIKCSLFCADTFAQGSETQLSDRYRFFRADEQYLDATKQELTMSPVGEFKRIPLFNNSEHYLSIGGDYRHRYEYNSNQAFGLRGDYSTDAFNHRFMLHGDLNTPYMRTFIQLSANEQQGNIEIPAPTSESSIDFHQAFVDFSPSWGIIRLGRQELNLGAGKKTGIREGPNQRRAFDGARVKLSNVKGTDVDLFYLKEVQPQHEAFSDSSTKGPKFYGAYANSIASLLNDVALDLFYFGYEKESSIYFQGTKDETRHSLGVRLYKNNGAIQFDYEATYQFGDFGSSDISAWGLATETSYGLNDMTWKPRAGVRFNIASGDSDSTDGELGTYNALFPNPTYVSDAAIIHPGNEFDLQLFVKLHARENLSLFAGIDFLWRIESQDALYGVPGVPLISASESSNNFAATFFNFNATYILNPYISIQSGYVYAQAEDVIRHAKGENTNFMFFQLALRF
ncbi:hypothetical protein CWB58_03035 [Pseudoalteromonas sp. S201]|uniref:alginate export family protein n=1 Tax=Pseudoalteromonas sp. S201 TaxID=579519 RepID=UPI00110CE9FF|nr:alginate export family protein [Pseudoalteromonas sp. S201]TMS94721.1 hypothetical protein CWB58_03035 [Pseudoalteromonas sp. S201]